jgi:hypothetical protein
VNTSAVTRFNGPVGQTHALGSLSTDAGGSTELGGDLHTLGNVYFGDTVALADSLTITHGGLVFAAALDSSHDLTIDSAAATRFYGNVSLGGLTSIGSGLTRLEAPASTISTTGKQSYSGDLILAGNDTELSASELEFGRDLIAGTNLTLTTDRLSLARNLTGSGLLAIRSLGVGTSVGIGSGTGDLQVTQGMLASATGFSAAMIGRVDGSGAVAIGDVALGMHTTVQSHTGNITVSGPVDSAAGGYYDLHLNTGGVTTIRSAIGATRALRNLSTDDNPTVANHVAGAAGGERTVFDTGGTAIVRATESIVFNDPVVASHALDWQAGTQILALSRGNEFTQTLSLQTAHTQIYNAENLRLGMVHLSGAGAHEFVSAKKITLENNLQLDAGSLLLRAEAVPTTLARFTDPTYDYGAVTVGLSATLGEASAGIDQTGGTITTASGSRLVLRTPNGASILLTSAGNDIRGTVSAVAGMIGEPLTSPRISTQASGEVRASFIVLTSKQINVEGRPADASDQSLMSAGIEGDVVVLTADSVRTSPYGGLIRARLPYDNNQGISTAMPALTINVTAAGLNGSSNYGGIAPADRIAVSLGNSTGSYATIRPTGGASLGPGYVSLGGDEALRPFYDGSGKLTEVPLFYNGLAPDSPQVIGALSSVTSAIEEARRARFEQAVRTENVSSRLRTGVIVEVGAGRPATEGGGALLGADTCPPRPNTLECL